MKYQVEFNEELFCYLKHNFEINWMLVAKCPVAIISCIFRTIFAKKKREKDPNKIIWQYCFINNRIHIYCFIKSHSGGNFFLLYYHKKKIFVTKILPGMAYELLKQLQQLNHLINLYHSLQSTLMGVFHL